MKAGRIPLPNNLPSVNHKEGPGLLLFYLEAFVEGKIQGFFDGRFVHLRRDSAIGHIADRPLFLGELFIAGERDGLKKNIPSFPGKKRASLVSVEDGLSSRNSLGRESYGFSVPIDIYLHFFRAGESWGYAHGKIIF
jgi:hypothetical protein